VLTVTGAKKVSGGNNHACALTTSGQVYCWGAGSFGQLGNNSTFGTSTPALVQGSGVYRDLGCGENDTCAAQVSGSFSCWGDNSRGQLNDFSSTNRLVPTTASNLGFGRYDLLVVGERTTYAFGGNDARCDGAASDGQLGNGAISEDPAGGWTACHVNSGARFIVAGDASAMHSCTVEAALGKVFCSGNNGSGQLGNGGTTSTITPVEALGLTNVSAVATGWLHTCALRADGSVWCWGFNSNGQLGDGTGTTRLSPTLVPGLSGVTQIAAANNQTCALKNDGSVWCWGNNDNGQLGNGSQASRATPTRVQL
jgi:alpha-tubulin suppressor-like RCC1 family protein